MQVKLFHGFDEFRETFGAVGLLPDVAETVGAILTEVRSRGDAAVQEYTERFDGVQVEEFRVPESQLQQALASVDSELREVLEQAAANIRRFHERQKTDSQLDFSPDGTILGWKVTAVDSAGVYIPGGRAFYPSSLLMNVIPAQVAGVPRIAMVSPPGKDGRPHQLVMACAALLGVTELYAVGGAQAVGALAYGTKSIPKVVKITGPGNAYVAEAKRQLFGRVGIDLFAGPTETLVIADDSCDAELCAVDLLGQAEHGLNSPAVLLTNSETLARDTMSEVDRELTILPTAETAGQAWRDYGQVIVCDTEEEMIVKADEIASEHVQVMTRNPKTFLDGMTNYGALFLGQETNVSYGDKVIGTNHTLPTKKAARYTGGLWVGKFLKTCTYQRVLTKEASVLIGEYCSRLCALENFAGHKEQADIRVRRYTQ